MRNVFKDFHLNPSSSVIAIDLGVHKSRDVSYIMYYNVNMVFIMQWFKGNERMHL